MNIDARIAIRQASALHLELCKQGHPAFQTIEQRFECLREYAKERGKSIRDLSDSELINYRNRLILVLYAWMLDIEMAHEDHEPDWKAVARSLMSWRGKRAADNQMDEMVLKGFF